MILYILRLIIFLWLVSLIFKFLQSFGISKKTTSINNSTNNADYSSEIPFTGEVEDADFEEINNK